MGKFVCGICGGPTDNDQSFDLPSGYHVEMHRCAACDKRLDLEYEWQSLDEHYRERSIICPHCGYEFEDYDAYGFDEGGHDAVECPDCMKHFDLVVVEVREYSTKRSVCDMPDDFDTEKEKEFYT